MKEIKNKVNTNKDYGRQHFRSALLFFFPILFGTFFQQLYNTADAVVVGRFVGKQALAAVGGTTSTDQSSGGLFRWPFQWCDCSYFPVLWCQKAG